MDNLIETVMDLKDEFQINSDGQVMVSIRGAAQLLGVSHVALVKNLGNSESSEMAKMLVEQGFKPGNLAKLGIPDTALAVMAQFTLLLLLHLLCYVSSFFSPIRFPSPSVVTPTILALPLISPPLT